MLALPLLLLLLLLRAGCLSRLALACPFQLRGTLTMRCWRLLALLPLLVRLVPLTAGVAKRRVAQQLGPWCAVCQPAVLLLLLLQFVLLQHCHVEEVRHG